MIPMFCWTLVFNMSHTTKLHHKFRVARYLMLVKWNILHIFHSKVLSQMLATLFIKIEILLCLVGIWMFHCGGLLSSLNHFYFLSPSVPEKKMFKTKRKKSIWFSQKWTYIILSRALSKCIERFFKLANIKNKFSDMSQIKFSLFFLWKKFPFPSAHHWHECPPLSFFCF